MLYSFSAINKILAGVALTALLASCTGDDKTETAPAEPQPISRLDVVIEQYAELDSVDRAEVIDSERSRLQAFAVAVGIDTINDATVTTMSTWPATVDFAPAVNAIFTDLKAEEAALGNILAVARTNSLSLPANDYAAVTWPKRQSIGFADSVMMIALNHYLGADHEAYTRWPQYMRRLKTRSMLPLDMAEALTATAYPFNPDGDVTVAKRLLYEGALAVAKERMVPGAQLADVLGIDPERFDDVVSHEGFMWRQLTAANRLYSADQAMLDDLFTLRDVTPSISPDAPGRAARYIGYRIVKSYLTKHPDASLKTLLSPDFYDNPVVVLRDAAYSPQ